MTHDEGHLRLLSIFHYVLGALAGLAGLFPLLPIIDLTGVMNEISPNMGSTPEMEEPWLALNLTYWSAILVASAITVAAWIFTSLVIATGRFLSQRRHYRFCLAMAVIECIFQPFGTVLGLFTLIVLMRDSVKHLFSAGESPDSPEPALT